MIQLPIRATAMSTASFISHADQAPLFAINRNSAPRLARCLSWLGVAAMHAAAPSAVAAVTDLAGNLSQVLDTAVGSGNSARLTANTKVIWNGTTAASNVNLNGFELDIDTGGGNAQTYNGAISGPGSLRLVGRGDASWTPDIQIGGTSANTPESVRIDYGRVQLNKAAGVDALAGPITVNTSDTVRIQLLRSEQINDASTLTTTASSGAFHLELGGFHETIAALTMKTGHTVDTGNGGILKVTSLSVGGISQPKGAYTASSGFVTGTGYIEVDNFGPPVIVQAPGVPASPVPADGAVTVHPATFGSLSWAPASDATSYDVYLWMAVDPKPPTPTANVGAYQYNLASAVLSLTNYHWQVVAKNAIGSTVGPIWSFATVDRNDISGNLTLTLDAVVGVGPARLTGNATTWWGGTTSVANINLNGFQFTIYNGGGNAQTYNGAISGPGTLCMQGRRDASWSPDIQIGGTSANTPESVRIDYGRVQLNKAAGVDALAGPITVNTSGTVRIQLLRSEQINDASTLTTTASSGAFHLELGGFHETIATLTIKAGDTVDTGSEGLLTLTKLSVNGVNLPPGNYTSSSSFVTGSGSVVVVGAAVPPIAAMSTVVASAAAVMADGVSSTPVTVTLRDSVGPVAGKAVTLASGRGLADTISAASGLSDSTGVVSFTVSSLTAGAALFTATDISDGITLSQTVGLTFVAVPTPVDISNGLGPLVDGGIKIDAVVGTGHSGRLVGITQTYWASGGYAVPLDLNGNTLVIDSGGGNTMNATGAISGNGLVKINAGGIGILRIGGSLGNTYSGTTEVNNGPVSLEKSGGNALCGAITVNGTMSNHFPGTGTLLWGGDNQIDDGSSLTLSGGASLNFAGHSDTMGTLVLADDASIYLGNGTSIVRFANCSATGWTSNRQLIIYDWKGALGGGGSSGVYFGNSEGGLLPGQIANVGFMNPEGFAGGLYHATLLDSGEVVPTGTAVRAISPPYDLSPAAVSARATSYISSGRADLTKVGSPLTNGSHIVFFGDSITWLNGYISLLDAALATGAGTQDKSIRLINRGINGGGVLQVRDGSPDSGYPGSMPQASFASLLTSDQATIAVVFIGINDVWWRGTSAATYEQALRDLAASAAAKDVRLIFATPAAHNESPIGGDSLDPAIDQFCAIVQTVAVDTGATFVNLRQAFVNYWKNNNFGIRLDGSFLTLHRNGLLTYDGVHPTDIGNQLIADKMAESLLATLTPASGFDVWAAGMGLSGAAAAFTADPDQDGIVNGLEFVLGGDPNPAHAGANSSGILPTAASHGDSLVFSYTCSHAAAYLNPLVEFSADLLGSWTTATAGNATIAVTVGASSDTVTVTLPKGATTRLFARLKVVGP